MTVHTLDPLQDDRWSELVRGHPAASVFHDRGWIDALKRTYGYEPIVYTTSAPGAALTNGILLCRIRSWLTGRRLVSVPFADHCEPLAGPGESRTALIEALRATTDSEWRYVELRPKDARWSAAGFTASEQFVHHEIDLRRPLDELVSAFHKSTIQRKIRRAEREGLVCLTGSSKEFVDAFYRLMLATRRRHGLPPQPAAWFENLIAAFGPRAMIRLASRNDRVIASIFTLEHGDTLVYKYGCSDAALHSSGAMPFLFWKAIQDAHAAGLHRLDLGRSDLDNPGLIQFKERLGGAPSTLTYVRAAADGRQATSRRGRRLPSWLVTRMPDRLLATTGHLLYRHMA